MAIFTHTQTLKVNNNLIKWNLIILSRCWMVVVWRKIDVYSKNIRVEDGECLVFYNGTENYIQQKEEKKRKHNNGNIVIEDLFGAFEGINY